MILLILKVLLYLYIIATYPLWLIIVGSVIAVMLYKYTFDNKIRDIEIPKILKVMSYMVGFILSWLAALTSVYKLIVGYSDKEIRELEDAVDNFNRMIKF